MAYFNDISSCCTGLMLEHLNGTKQQIRERILCKRTFGNGAVWTPRDTTDTHCVIIAITTDSQRPARELLDEIGFGRSGPFTKHGYTQREKDTGSLVVHTMNAYDFWQWFVAAKAEANPQPAPRRFGVNTLPLLDPRPVIIDPEPWPIPEALRPINPPPPRRVPRCEIRSMRRHGYLRDDERGTGRVPQFRHNHDIPIRYGVSEQDYRDAQADAFTLADFTQNMRAFQQRRENEGRIVIGDWDE